MRERLCDLSIRGKNLGFYLLVDLAVAIYYYPQVLRLLVAGDEALYGPAMVNLIIKTVFVAIVVSTVLSVYLHNQQKPEPMDERDLAIRARGKLWAGHVLVWCLVLLIGQIILQEMSGQWFTALPVLMLTPLIIAHLLLVVLMLASLCDNLVRLSGYRRGY